MQNVFNELLSFTVNIKPEIERAIHTFSVGGGQAGEVQVFIDAFFEEVSYNPPLGGNDTILLGMTAMVVKFPEWLANRDYETIYQRFVTTFKEQGMLTKGSSLHEVKTYVGLNRAALVREAIQKLDSTFETAKGLLESKKEEKKK